MKRKLLLLSFFASIGSVLAQPVITANGPTTFCAGNSVTLSSSPGVNYIWYKDGTSIGTNSSTYVATSSGSYRVRVMGKYSNTISVTTNPLPTATIAGGSSQGLCPGSTLVLTANNSGTNYLWSSGETTNSITVNSAGVFNVTVTDQNGCSKQSSNITTYFETQPEALVISADGPTVFCMGDSVSLKTGTAYEYRWYKDNTLINGANSSVFFASELGSYTVKAFSGKCLSEPSNAIDVGYHPQEASIFPSEDISICEGSTTTLTANDAGPDAAYLWSTGETTSSIDVSTEGSVYVIVTNSYGCSEKSPEVIISFIPRPNPISIVAAGATSFCPGSSVMLKADEAQYYRWYRDNNELPNDTIQTLETSLPGTYTVRAFSGLCLSNPSNEIEVSILPVPAANISPSGDTTICEGGTLDLFVSDAGTDGSYSWSNGETTPSINISAAGSYTVVVTNTYGCSNLSEPVEVYLSSIQSSISPNDSVYLCNGDSAVLTANEAPSYLWSNGETTQSITTFETGSYSVTVWNEHGCQAVSEPVTVVTGAPQVDAGDDQIIYLGYGDQSVLINANVGEGSISGFSWGDGNTNSTTLVSPTTTTTYSITVTDQWGCTATDSVTVTVVDIRCGENFDKVIICHTSDNNSYSNTICVSQESVEKHLLHGDQLGECLSITKNGKGSKLRTGTISSENPVPLHVAYSDPKISFTPNPFSQSTRLAYQIDQENLVTIEIYNILGEKVKTVVQTKQSRGSYNVNIDATELNLSDNIYLVKLQIGNETATKKIIKTK